MKLTKLTKAQLYETIQAEGYHLPKITSTACKLSYLVNVRAGNEYCPLSEEVGLFTCNNPPKRVILIQIIFEELQRRQDERTLSFDEKHVPDVDWCLSAISALDPLHPIFEPGYMPANEDRGRRGRKYTPNAEELVYMIEFNQNRKNKDFNEKINQSQCSVISKNNQSAQLHSQEIKKKQNKQNYEQTFHQREICIDFETNLPKQRQKQIVARTLCSDTTQKAHTFHKQDYLQSSQEDTQTQFVSQKMENKSYPVSSSNVNAQPTVIATRSQVLLDRFDLLNFKHSDAHDSDQLKEANQDSQLEKNGNGKQRGPLINMLLKLEKKGLLDQCMQQYIQIQQQYEQSQIDSEGSSNRQPDKDSAIAVHQDRIDLPCKEFKEGKMESPAQIHQRKRMPENSSKKITMNQLMDDSQLNQSDYEEVAFKENSFEADDVKSQQKATDSQALAQTTATDTQCQQVPCQLQPSTESANLRLNGLVEDHE